MKDEADGTTPAAAKQKLYAVLMAAAGTSLFEMYDFQVYGYLAAFVAEEFFPANQAGNTALIEAFGAYAAAFLMRPLGGLFFGQHGDTHGRKSALLQSTILMALPSLVIGLLPGVKKLGIVATIGLLICRMLQGFALGGQLSGSYVIMVEAAPEAQRGFYGSLVTAAGSCGAALASGCVAATAAALSEQQMAAWGWRIPFILGGALAPSSIALALWFAPEDSSSGGEEGEGGGPTLQSTSALDEADAAKLAGECSKEATSLTKDASPVKVVLVKEVRRMLLLVGCVGGSAVGYYFKVWLVTYLATLAGYVSYRDAALVSTATLALELPLYLSAGWAVDTWAAKYQTDPHVTRTKMIASGQLFLLLFAPLFFYWLKASNGSLKVVFTGQIIWVVAIAASSANLAAFEVETWQRSPTPGAVYTGVALSHSIAMVLFGGLVPTIATSLYDASWAPAAAPFYYVSAVSALSLSCCWLRSFGDKHLRTGHRAGSGEHAPLLPAA